MRVCTELQVVTKTIGDLRPCADFTEEAPMKTMNPEAGMALPYSCQEATVRLALACCRLL